MSHPIKATPNRQKPGIERADSQAPKWPSFKGASQSVRSTASGRRNVFVDRTLGAPGLQKARDLVNDGDRVANANDAIFGTTGGTVSVIVFGICTWRNDRWHRWHGPHGLRLYDARVRYQSVPAVAPAR